MPMKYLSTTFFLFFLSFTSFVFSATPELQQAIAMWENGQVSEAFPVFLKYKDSDDADALAYLGRSYMNGLGVEKNYSLAFEYFGKAAELGQPYGLNGVGVCYRQGCGIQQDLQKAEKYFLQAAEAGCPLAEFNLGMLYLGGFEVAEGTPTIPDFGNVTKALEHFRASYDAGNLKPQCAEHLGILMLTGETPAEALPWLQEAAAGNQPDAIVELAFQFECGGVVPIDRNQAIDYAEQFGRLTGGWELYANICYRIGIEYLFRGQWREAMLFLQLAADKGHVDAQYQLATYHQDDSIRGKYAVMAAQNGNQQVLVQAGTYLANQKQYDEAMKCYLEAAEAGDRQAMCEIAIMHRIGEGVPVNYEKSMEWYAKAAEQYYPRALRELGVKYLLLYDEDPKKEFYAKIPATLSKAYALMAQAVLYGDDDAWGKLNAFPFIEELPTMVPDDTDMELAKGLVGLFYAPEDKLAESLKLLEASAVHGNVDAMNALGYLYSLSNAPFHDLAKSAESYKMAAAKGNDYAAKQLCSRYYQSVLNEQEYLDYLKAQAEKGFGVALHNLAEYHTEKGDLKKALQLHLENARNGDDHSVMRLFFLSLYSDEVEPQCDAEEIERLLIQAEQRHNSEAEYIRSEFTGGDSRESAILLMRSILDGADVDVAWFALGQLYRQGNGVPREPNFAVELFERAIRAGYWEACTMLGDILSKGEYSVRKDSEYAKEIFQLGAEHDVKGCQERLEAIQAEIQKEQPKQGE